MAKTRYLVRPRPRLQKLQRDIRKQFGVYKSTYLAKVDGAIRLPGGLFWVHDATGTDANGNTTYGAPRKMPMLPGAAIFPRPNTKVDVVTVQGIDYIARTNSFELERMGVDPHQSNTLDPVVQYKAIDWLINLQAFKTPGASSTHIIGSIYKKPDGEYAVFPTTGGYDFVTANVPSTDNQVVVCQWIDTDTNTISVTVSSEESRDTDLKHPDNIATTITLINECVAAAPTNHIGVNAWRIYDDTTIGTLDDNNKLADLRGIVGAGGTTSGAPSTATYITQTPDTGLSNEQALSALATGLLKNTTTTGVLSIATNADVPEFTGANGVSGGTKGGVPAPVAADNVNYLRGDGTWALPSGTGAPASAKYITYGYDGTLSAEKAIPAWEFHSDIEPASPNAADDEFAGSSLDGDWSWVNQGSASAAVAKSRVLLTVPSTTTGNIRGIFRTYPGQSTWETQITGWSSAPFFSGAGSNYYFGMARRDSGSGRIELFVLAWIPNTATMLILCERFTNTTTYNSTVTSISLGRRMAESMYLRLADDNTNVALSWSLDGVNYTALTSFVRAAFLASADQIGLCIFTQQNGGNVYLQSDWMRRTA